MACRKRKRRPSQRQKNPSLHNRQTRNIPCSTRQHFRLRSLRQPRESPKPPQKNLSPTRFRRLLPPHASRPRPRRIRHRFQTPSLGHRCYQNHNRRSRRKNDRHFRKPKHSLGKPNQLQRQTPRSSPRRDQRSKLNLATIPINKFTNP